MRPNTNILERQSFVKSAATDVNIWRAQIYHQGCEGRVASRLWGAAHIRNVRGICPVQERGAQCRDKVEATSYVLVAEPRQRSLAEAASEG